MLRQLFALAALKIALFRHTWTARRGASYAVSLVFLLAGLAAAAGAGYWLHQLGAGALARRTPGEMLVILDSIVMLFLFFWMFGLLMELQRADVVDLRKMLHLPVSLRVVYGLNFLASLVSPGLVFYCAGAGGLVAGLVRADGPRMLWAAPLAAAFYLALAAWAYYLRGWLAMLMENQRRRRLILVVLPLIMVAAMQLPQFFPHLAGADGTAAGAAPPPGLFLLNAALPLFWLPGGIVLLHQGELAPALAFTGGFVIIMAAGLGLGYRRTLRHYMGRTRERGVAPAARPGKPESAGLPLTARSLPGFDGQASALVMASFLGLYRHPRIRLTMVLTAFLGGILFFLHTPASRTVEGPVAHILLPSLLLAWPFFNFAMIFFNQFGMDLQGFRGLMLMPVARRTCLLAKNVALFPFVAGFCLLFLAAAALFSNIPWRIWLIAVAQVPVLFLGFAAAGNALSLYFPYRMVSRNTRGKGANRPVLLLIGLGAMAVVTVMMTPVLACFMLEEYAVRASGAAMPGAGLAATLALLLVMAAVYRGSLGITGRILERREQIILGQLLKDAD